MKQSKRVIGMIVALCFVSVYIPVGAAAVTPTNPEDLRLTDQEVQEYVKTLRQNSGSGWTTAEAGTATIIVAASDSNATAKAEAQYVCDGSNDHAEIQAALNALPDGGGTVLLTEGEFHCVGNIQPPAYGTLRGQGPNATFLEFPQGGGFRIRSPYVTFADFTSTGTSEMLVMQSHARIHNITLTLDNSGLGAFYVWAFGKVIEDVEFVNCKAIDCGRYGFLNTGESSPRLIKNIRYINCEAINCGRYSYVRTGPWVTGFDIVEKNDIQDAWLIGCRAEGSQESGFHLEGIDALSIENVHFTRCVSINNGQKGKDQCMFGAGFTLPKGCILEDCYAANNKRGYFIAGGGVSKAHDVALINCTDNGSDFGFWASHGYNFTLTNCTSNDAAKQGLMLSKAWNVQVKGFAMNNATGYPLHAGSSTITGVKVAATKSADDPYAGGMWRGPVTDSQIDIQAQGCAADTVLCLEYAQRVNVTGTIVSENPTPVKIIGGSAVDISGLEIISRNATEAPVFQSTAAGSPNNV